MNSPNAFIKFLLEFHCTRDYFECHEILEEYWKEEPSNRRNPVWVGFIQLAVSLYHYRRKNVKGASRSLSKAKRILMEQQMQVDALGIHFNALIELISRVESRLEQGKDYESISLPLKKPLLDLCMQESKERKLTWISQSDLNNYELINRHKTRDRSDVIKERTKQLQLRHTKE
ncbi:DUF309 domain-containing protein [Peribacillus deserti]|uniref:DUF309 domain-containing protein n=1 Tax=Peribacillus deserti TaxID=673318 RepID=A0A2N5M1N3_9BACI|nr:DUF309 domain-containing protein [Peribacillus deserti]PLT28278.1 DUF309 domain-containing protein [Peribacillus deserti]